MKSVSFVAVLLSMVACSVVEAGPLVVRRGLFRRPVAIKQPVVVGRQAFILQQHHVAPQSQAIILFQR